jgi:hypothetical protein
MLIGNIKKIERSIHQRVRQLTDLADVAFSLVTRVGQVRDQDSRTAMISGAFLMWQLVIL